jgi:hypothetical protein
MGPWHMMRSYVLEECQALGGRMLALGALGPHGTLWLRLSNWLEGLFLGEHTTRNLLWIKDTLEVETLDIGECETL